VHPNLQSILSQHQVFSNTPYGIPPSHNIHDHSIPLVPGSLPPNIHPYLYPFTEKNEIGKIVQELLEPGVMHPITNPYSSLVVMVLNKQGTWSMCHDFHTFNKLTFKEKFTIPIIDDLLDKLSGDQYFTKLDLHSGYHHIHMK
jgi:hypothetical protein